MTDMILCVENEPTVLETRKLVLQSAGYGVLTARSAVDALRLFHSQSVRAVVLAYDLPVTNGTQLAAQMKRLKAYVPILMIGGANVFTQAALATVNKFMVKGEGPGAILMALLEMVSYDDSIVPIPTISTTAR